MLSKAEREFLENLRTGKVSQYNANYRRVLKHKISKKRESLTADLLLVNEVWNKLQEL